MNKKEHPLRWRMLLLFYCPANASLIRLYSSFVIASTAEIRITKFNHSLIGPVHKIIRFPQGEAIIPLLRICNNLIIHFRCRHMDSG